MTAAPTLANAGLPVKLVEREAALGGMLRDVHTLYPDRRSAAEFVAEKAEEVTSDPRIGVLLESQVTDVSGTVGRLYSQRQRFSDLRCGSDHRRHWRARLATVGPVPLRWEARSYTARV